MQNASPWIAVAALTVIALVGVACWLWARRRAKDDIEAMTYRGEDHHAMPRHLHGEQPRDKSGRWV